ncbi:MAG: hypothetical protein OXG98_10610 [Gemmatimonadetes bacterium]|nr:hypothetical protein [Gemmatimonadota bacterium]
MPSSISKVRSALSRMSSPLKNPSSYWVRPFQICPSPVFMSYCMRSPTTTFMSSCSRG